MTDWIKKVWYCWILDRPTNVMFQVQGPLPHRTENQGDGYDTFGVCERCGKMAHKDDHWTSDGVWRHE